MARAAIFRDSSEWKAVRQRKRARNPVCEDPMGWHKDRGETEPAEEVHHIVPLSVDWSKRFTWSNLQSVCKRCHTAVERKAEVSRRLAAVSPDFVKRVKKVLQIGGMNGEGLSRGGVGKKV